MKQRILRGITSILLIMTLTMANVLLLCADVVSYAAENINAERSTSHKNVEFMAYFKDEAQTTEMDISTDKKETKLYFQVSVKQEGYLNGTITLNDANFKFKPEVLSDSVNRIEDNVIYLNQIKAGETKEIEVNVEILNNEEFDLRMLSMESSISLNAIYRDSTQKDINVTSTRKVKLNLISPYTEEGENIILSQNIVTNKVFEIAGTKKRVVQLKVESGVYENLFPIKKSEIKLIVPKISNSYPEQVYVRSNSELVTTGKMLENNEWNYNTDSKEITITLENKENNGKISWLKSGKDSFIITYILDENAQLNNERFEVQSNIELYDNLTKMNATAGNSISNIERDNIVTTNIVQKEDSIYKGKLIEGISRDITYTDEININLENVTNKISVIEDRQTIGDEIINSTYKTTELDKNNLNSILGTSGSLYIIDNDNNNVIATVNNNTVANENGKIVITYPENIQSVRFELAYAEGLGKLSLINTRTIKATNKETVKAQNSISTTSAVSYVIGSEENKLGTAESIITLLDTQTSANLQINRNELSAMAVNENVEFRITLNSKQEKDELYKNPTLRLTLPQRIEDIEITTINLLYEDELQIASTNLNGNTLEIALSGEQTKYKEEAIDGAVILIKANLKTSMRYANTTEQVVLEYTNQKATNYLNNGIIVKDIKIVSYAGLVTINQVPEYGIDIVNNEGNNVATLSVADTEKNAVIQNRIINNNENKITNVKILGTFPTKGATESNNIETEVGNIEVSGINANRVKVYYSDKANATVDSSNDWTNAISNSKTVKKYLIVIDELDLQEEVNFNYAMNIPGNLEYSMSAEQGYEVYYNNITVQEKITTKNIKFATPRGTILETKLKSLVAGKESDTVKENEIIRYEIVVSNIGSEDVSNVVVVAEVPEGTTYIQSNKLNGQIGEEDTIFEDATKKNVEFNISSIPSGREVVEYYEVLVNKGMAGKEITNMTITKYGEMNKKSNTVITTVEEGNLKLQLASMDAENGILNSGYQYGFALNVTNESNKTLNNVKVVLAENEKLQIERIYYVDENENSEIVMGQNNITIKEIKAGETVEVGINTMVPIFKDSTAANISIFAKAMANNKEYNSNEIRLTVVSNIALDLSVDSPNAGEYVKAGDTIKYNVMISNNGIEDARIVNLTNTIPNDITITRILRNGVELAKENYSLATDSTKHQKVLTLSEEVIEKGNTVKYEIEAVVNLLYGNNKPIELVNEYSLNVRSYELENAKITHILQPENNDNQDNGNNNDGNNNNNNEGSENPSNPSDEDVIYDVTPNNMISGVAWIDENENGQKDMNEKELEGITVRLLNASTNEFLKDSEGNIVTAKTSSTGFYSFNNIQNGQYVAVFEYNTIQFGLTTFEKTGVPSNMNSNVITKNINIEGLQQTVAATEMLNINNSSASNINIGLVNAKKYDLKLEKYISKVTVQNDKTETETYTNAKLAKHEIDAKQVNSTIVVVEYTIKVTNNGDVPAYVKKIADYLSSDYKFNSELNKDWYQSGNDVYCTSLANEEIKPGDSKEVTLTVIKEMKENNTGLVTNTAEIVSSYNEYGLTDVNSKEGNKAKGENDMDSADLIISIKTGQVVMTITLIVSAMIALGITILVLRRVILHKRLI